MNIKAQIEQDFLTAYKAKAEIKVSVLRLLKSAIANAEIAAKKELSDDEVVKILYKEIKQREDSVSEYSKVGRKESADKEQEEIDLIKPYLPAQLDDAEIEKIVDRVIAETGATSPKEMGLVMSRVMSEAGSGASGSTVSAIVKNKLLS